MAEALQRCMELSPSLESSLAGENDVVGSPVERGRARSAVKKAGRYSYTEAVIGR